MKILLLTQVVPYPPDSGPKIKTYNVLRWLAQTHEVHLISFARSPEEATNATKLQHLCASITAVPLRRSLYRDLGYMVRSLANRRPFLVERDDSPAMRAAIARLLDQHAFDAVHADQLSMAQFAVDLPIRCRVFDEHNAVWTIVQRAARHELRGARQLLAELEWRKLRAYEGEVCRRFDWVTAVSQSDREALEQAAGRTLPCPVVPIAVGAGDQPFVPRTAETRHVLSVATMFYPPNVEGVMWFAKEVFPHIRNAVPDTRFLVVGSRPPKNVTRLATAESGIDVTGYIADLEPVLRQSAVLIAPVRVGSGMRVKILEAFASGIPVVSTTIGVEGIDAMPDEHLLVADRPKDFASAVIRILRDRGVAERLAFAGRGLVEARYDWRTALTGLNRIYSPTNVVVGAGTSSQSIQGAASVSRLVTGA